MPAEHSFETWEPLAAVAEESRVVFDLRMGFGCGSRKFHV